VVLLGLGTSNGAARAAIPGTYNFLNSLSCPTQTQCIAVGGSSPASGPQGALVEATNTGGLSWWQQDAPTGTAQLRAITCPTAEECFAAGDSGIVATTNGGRTWTAQAIADPSTLGTFTAIKCPTALRCYAITALSVSGTSRLITTTDGGAQWNNQAGPPGLGYAADLSCPGPATCFVVGNGPSSDSYQQPPAVIVATFDGGTQWVQQLSYGASESDEEYSNLDSVTCPSATTCLAAGSGIWGTTDSGADWTLRTTTGIAFAGPRVYTSADCPRTIDCYAADDNYTADTNYVRVSTNGGWTFTNGSTSQLDAGIIDLSCPVYFRCYATDGTNLVTTGDSGQTWIAQTVPGLGYNP
jgi:photosystem II stability/assembly factor-like uncharacterized protein